MTIIDHKKPAKRALVVFSGQTDLIWLRILRPGFRHCFVLLECDGEGGPEAGTIGSKWVLYNPLSNTTQIALWAVEGDCVLRAGLVQQGYTVVETYVRLAPQETLPWRPFTCVEAVKRALGLYKKGLFTPWSLYIFLINEI